MTPGWAALKVFDQRLVADPDVRRRLSFGAIAASVVREPHVASVIDSDTGDDSDRPWVASTLVRGPSLAAAVSRDRAAARRHGRLDRPRPRPRAQHAARGRAHPRRGLPA